MKLLILAIGKRHDRSLAKAIEDYSGRVGRYTSLSWRLLDPARGKQGAISSRRAETATLTAELLPDDFVVVLDERGRQMTSTQLATLLELQQSQAVKRVVFIIGGAYGVDDSVRKRANVSWSLSELIFPHQLVRLMLVEQLYRAFTIIADEPYHHA